MTIDRARRGLSAILYAIPHAILYAILYTGEIVSRLLKSHQFFLDFRFVPKYKTPKNDCLPLLSLTRKVSCACAFEVIERTERSPRTRVLTLARDGTSR